MAEIPSSRFRKCAIALSVASCLSLLSSGAMAAGLGKLSIFSSLGQPLNAEVELSATPEELVGMTARLAPREIFKQAGVEFVPPLNDLRMAVEKRQDGKAVVRLTSVRPVSEPFLDFLVELNWPSGRVIREYTFLLDPPDFAGAQGRGSSVDAKLVDGVRDRQALATSAESAVRPTPKRVAPPARTLAAESGTQEDAGQHLVERGETLRKIAAEHLHAGVSLEQMLVALYRNNREAFIGNDINRLKAGVILDLPDAQAAASVSREEARKVYVSAGDFASYRRKLAGLAKEAPARQEAVATQGSAGRITPKVEEKQALVDPAKDQVKVARAEGASAAKAAAEAERIAAEKALEEAQTRVSMLERNVGELQKLLELKNQRLATLESAQAVPVPATPSVPPAPTVVPPVQDAKEAKPAAEVPVADAKPAVSEVKPAEAPAAAPAPMVPPEAVKPVTPPKPPVVPPVVEVPPAPDLLDTLLEDPLPLAGGAAALVLLAGLMVYRRRRTVVPPPSPTTAVPSSSSFGPNSIFGPVGGQSVDTASIAPHSSEFSQAGPGTIDTDEVDPVAEADVYMAYGRDAQAEEILLEAMLRDPGRLAIHLKLLEIYADRRSLKQFETLAGELYAQTAGLGAEWEKAAAMGRKIDPQNPLYGGGAAPSEDMPVSTSAPAFDPDATMVVRPGQSGAAFPGAVAAGAVGAAAWNEATIALSPGKAGKPAVEALDTLVNQAPLAPVPQSAHVDTMAAKDDMSLDFDLGVEKSSDATVEPVEAAPFVDTIVGPEVSDDNALDFDLDGMVGGNSSVGIVDLHHDSVPAETEALDLGSIDFGLDSAGALAFEIDEEPSVARSQDESDSLEVAQSQPSEEPSSADDGLSFDDLNEVEEVVVEPASSAPVFGMSSDEGLSAEDVNIDEMDFDVSLSDSVFLNEPLPEAAFDMNSINLDLDTPSPVQSAAEPQAEEGALSADWHAGLEPAIVEASAETSSLDFDETDAAEQAPAEAPHDENWEEVNTKLDLAKAYEEMGDLEGARELLQEVMLEGSGDLVAQAESMLQRIGA